MGLAAQQCRLLTITGRKSGCLSRLMELSHEKEIIARDKDIMFAEYENSLEQTKLVYDYYGTGDQSQQLNYGLVMNPSLINNYAPILLTDLKNRTILNSKYAAAARAAGIPQEGLGSLPSDIMRNTFLDGMYVNNIIDFEQLFQVKDIPYNQKAGFGVYELYSVTSEENSREVNIAGFMEEARQRCTAGVNAALLNNAIYTGDNQRAGYLIGRGENAAYKNGTALTLSGGTNFTLWDLLADSRTFTLQGAKQTTGNQDDATASINNVLSKSFISWLSYQFKGLLNPNDTASSQALALAATQLKEKLCATVRYSSNTNDHFKPTVTFNGNQSMPSVASGTTAANYLGIVKNGDKTELNLNNVAKAFLTLYAKNLNNENNDTLRVNYGKLDGNATSGTVTTSKFLTEYPDYQLTVYDGMTVNKEIETTRTASGFDAIFNYICIYGWSENNEIDDGDYLQRVLENGMLYVTRQKPDGFYYQGEYANDRYIQVINNDDAIAKAKSSYNTEELKLNQKEQTLDLKMKNLDTEVSALNTEYDSVKSTIDKNAERCFKRYSA
jgi:hypothetical protein